MQAVLTNGALVYAARTVFDPSEQSLLNEVLRTQQFSVEGHWLEWRSTEDPAAMPAASLRDRARIAHEVEQAHEAYLATQRQVEELARQRAELERLLRAGLGIQSDEVIFSWHDSVFATVGADEPPLFVRAEIEGLPFRLAPYRVGPSLLQVGLRCPRCVDYRWETIHDLSALGRALHYAEDAAAVCPLCSRLAQIGDDPFADQ